MFSLCEVTQIGHVGAVKSVGGNVVITVATSVPFKKDDKWQKKTRWVEHIIFARREALARWALESLNAGDQVAVRSAIEQSSWEKDGARVYGYTIALENIERLSAKDGDQVAPIGPDTVD